MTLFCYVEVFLLSSLPVGCYLHLRTFLSKIKMLQLSICMQGLCGTSDAANCFSSGFSFFLVTEATLTKIVVLLACITPGITCPFPSFCHFWRNDFSPSFLSMPINSSYGRIFSGTQNYTYLFSLSLSKGFLIGFHSFFFIWDYWGSYSLPAS